MRGLNLFHLFLLISSMIAWISPMPFAWAKPSQKQKPFHVVIDPGHGGADLGTTFKKRGVLITEKDVALKIALDVAKSIRQSGIQVTLTRESDREVSLADRTAIANRVKADVFFSIHLNSPGPDSVRPPEGIETYILNTATDQSSRRLAKLENAVLGASFEAADGQTDVALILKDIRLDANLAESKRLACLIHMNLVRIWVTPQDSKSRIQEIDRGVKQALFHVLLGADMPSALVEVGFLSHPRDRLNVVSAAGRAKIAEAFTNAIRHFKDLAGKPSGIREIEGCKVR